MHQGLLLARQPILDRALQLRGYELLARDSEGASPGPEGGHVATCQVLIDALGELGLEQVVGRLPAYINVTAEFLTGEIRLPLPAERVVLEILESIPIDESVLRGIRKLKAAGFTIALDDFTGLRPDYGPLLPLVDIVKVECLGASAEALETRVQELRPSRARLLAEKVETREVFEHCAGLGFELFQGFFFAKPDLLRGRRQAVDRTSLLSLLAKLQDPDATPEDLERIVIQDPVLSLKLLRFLNSAQFGLRRRIDSLREVVIYLGVESVRNIACLLLIARVDDKPRALMIQAMLRGRMCEELARGKAGSSPSRAFTVGLLSMLDALVDQQLNAVLATLPLHREIREALIYHSGELGSQLDAVLAYERGEFGRLAGAGKPALAVREAYLSSLSWVREVERELTTLA